MAVRTLLAGVLVGASVATLGWKMLSSSPPEPPKAVSISVEESVSAAKAEQAPLAKVASMTVDCPQNVVAPKAVPASLPSQAAAPAPTASSNQEAVGKLVALRPIQLSSEHAKVLLPERDATKPPSLPELHQQLVSEQRDEKWATETEQSIRAHLNASQAQPEFEIMSVECRQTLCEVLAFGNLGASGKRWNEIWAKAQDQTWYQGISGNSTSSSTQNQRSVLVTILNRAMRR